MTLGAVLLTLIGVADLVRAARRPAARRAPSVVAIALLWLAVLVVAVTGLGLAWWWALGAAALALGWLWTTSANPDARAATGILPAVGVLLALVVSLLANPSGSPVSGYLVEWHDDASAAVIRNLPIETLLLGVGATLFLVESANIVVRAALRPAIEESATALAATVAAEPVVRQRWWRRPQPMPVATGVVDLRGGRLIGPLERLLIVALTLAGGLPIVAGVLAAKGIVRFPEISTDGVRGSKAEYFLVGSLVSWTIAIVATGALWISAQG